MWEKWPFKSPCMEIHADNGNIGTTDADYCRYGTFDLGKTIPYTQSSSAIHTNLQQMKFLHLVTGYGTHLLSYRLPRISVIVTRKKQPVLKKQTLPIMVQYLMVSNTNGPLGWRGTYCGTELDARSVGNLFSKLSPWKALSRAESKRHI